MHRTDNWHRPLNAHLQTNCAVGEKCAGGDVNTWCYSAPTLGTCPTGGCSVNAAGDGLCQVRGQRS